MLVIRVVLLGPGLVVVRSSLLLWVHSILTKDAPQLTHAVDLDEAPAESGVMVSEASEDVNTATSAPNSLQLRTAILSCLASNASLQRKTLDLRTATTPPNLYAGIPTSSHPFSNVLSTSQDERSGCLHPLRFSGPCFITMCALIWTSQESEMSF